MATGDVASNIPQMIEATASAEPPTTERCHDTRSHRETLRHWADSIAVPLLEPPGDVGPHAKDQAGEHVARRAAVCGVDELVVGLAPEVVLDLGPASIPENLR